MRFSGTVSYGRRDYGVPQRSSGARMTSIKLEIMGVGMFVLERICLVQTCKSCQVYLNCEWGQD